MKKKPVRTGRIPACRDSAKRRTSLTAADILDAGGGHLTVYVDLVMALNFAVDFLLFLGTNRLCGYPACTGKAALAAGVGAAYAGACLMPGFRFLGNTLWRLVSLAGMSLIAFGMGKSAVRRGVLFLLLSLALGGAALGMGSGSVVPAAGLICLLCFLGFRREAGVAEYVPVELHYQDKTLHLTALRDTGNTLRDPVTGRPVLVVGPDAAHQLTGLSQAQLQHPVESVTALPGLRLIPYHTVGTDSGMLLAMKLPGVRIGSWRGNSLVAFAPEGLGKYGEYQALTGGAV